ncbi:toxin glutamine deamidase domain-containing protein [Actinoplanes sp. NPDC049596]|uniref:toxin glutamine deamidase domain-containing protein n=1 Tax=unclassified Actinoplanes TaxID=2626549 RepID=UPI003417F493
MSVLPSPVPHPLEYSPFDVPGWAYTALEWVVGFDWPAGNEVSTWDVADRWYALATALVEPNDAAFGAVSHILAGYEGSGADSFQDAWHRLAGDESAPLNALLEASHQLGGLVEGAGRDIEGAKLEAWIEIGIFLTELIGMGITVILTLGAASPAAGGMIVATRLAIQQIFRKLVEQLGAKALKQTATHAIKQLATKEGLRKLGREALDEGFDEAREELATNGAIQTYQQTTGRADGFDLGDLRTSAVAGFAGGAAASGAGVGSHGHHGVARGAGGEVLAEFGAAAAFGDLPDPGNLAKSATSGAAGSAVHSLPSNFNFAFGGTDLSAPDFDGGVFTGPLPENVPFAGGGQVAASPAPISADVVPGPLPTAAVDAQAPSVSSFAPTLDSSPASVVAVAGISAVPDVSPGPDIPPADSGATSISSSASASSSDSLSGSPSSSHSLSGSPSSSPSLSASPSPSSPAPSPASSSFSPSSSPSPLPSPSPSPSLAPLPSPSPDLAGQSTAAPATAPPTPPLPPAPAVSPVAGPGMTPWIPAMPSRPAASPDRRPPGATRRSPLSDLDRIADALGPRPTTTRRQPPLPLDRTPRPSEAARLDQALAPRVKPSPLSDRPRSQTNAPLDARPYVNRTPAPQPTPAQAEAAYFGYADHARRTYELNRRDDYATYLTGVADENRAKIFNLSRHADQVLRTGSTLEAQHYRKQALDLSDMVAEIESQIDQVRAGTLTPDTVEVSPAAWSRINRDVGNLAPGGVTTGDRSALARPSSHNTPTTSSTGMPTGDHTARTSAGNRPPIDATRHYNSVGGLRPPLAIHQVDLENAVPRDPDGRPARLPDPRSGRWFRLANDGGPTADPTRGLNCVDGVLSLFDTYIHGRPRVSAPRTFDTYAHGDPTRPLGGEQAGVDRIRQATGSDFQSLCPPLDRTTPTEAKQAMDLAFANLSNHLLNTGHGAYAFIITDLEAGGCHSWAAINHQGTVLFLDPQISQLSESTPLYHHTGTPTPSNITSMDALVVTANGTPAPLPHHPPGQWSTTPPTGLEDLPDDPASIEAIRAAERQAFDSLDSAERAVLSASLADAEVAAARMSGDLHAVVERLSVGARVTDEEHQVKSVESLGRKYLEAAETDNLSPEQFLNQVKDRVRFSVETPEGNYGATVARVLADLRRLGYRTRQAASFWAECGRHNGLNVWLSDPQGFLVEVQFPTPLSRQIGKLTHRSYEIMRFGGFDSFERVSAFLKMLAINKTLEISAHRPTDLGLIGSVKLKTSTLAEWLNSEEELLGQYREGLSAHDLSFKDHLRRYGLEPADVPGLDEMGLLE